MSEHRTVGGNPVRFFQDLYAVVVGVSLALAIDQIVDLDKSGVPIRWEHVPLFVSWLAVSLPFAHVFVRYLDIVYARRSERGGGKGLAMGNIVVGAGQYLWIISLALFVSRPIVFGYGLVLFLAGMIVREIILRLLPGGWLSELERRIGPVQVVAVAGWLLVLVAAQLSLSGGAQEWTIRGGVLAVSLVYAFGVYLRGFEFFFGSAPESGPA